MKKTAVIYDKWLRSMGGGEVVACTIAKILEEKGYEVTFICGKNISKRIIKQKLNIDFSKIHVIEVWNDESQIKKISNSKDLFINLSFIDYTFGYSKKNIYYTHFPKEPYNSLRGRLVINFLLPFAAKFIKPIEFLNDINITSIKDNKPAYLLKNDNRIAISYLEKNKSYRLEFSLFLEYFYKSLLKAISFNLDGAQVLQKKVNINHFENQIDFCLTIKPSSTTTYVNLEIANNRLEVKDKKRVYLLYPKVSVWNIYEPFYKQLYQRVNTRLRAGFFSNPLERLKSYKIILANSEYTRKWIKNYWKRNSTILYPPVDMLFRRYNVDHFKKEKWICSVGRFFTLGHGKRQEILIKSFKKLYNNGYRDWQLHLVGGVGNEPTSMKFLQKLKVEARGYPVFFHLNVSKEEVERIYLHSSIYWHAAGFGENESRNPIKFEHFGIAPLEAISAKCIPILFNGGGLRETIFESGFDEKNLFKSINQLMDNTVYFIDKKPDINWDNIFEKINKKFSVEAFKKKFLELI